MLVPSTAVIARYTAHIRGRISLGAQIVHDFAVGADEEHCGKRMPFGEGIADFRSQKRGIGDGNAKSANGGPTVVPDARPDEPVLEAENGLSFHGEGLRSLFRRFRPTPQSRVGTRRERR